VPDSSYSDALDLEGVPYRPDEGEHPTKLIGTLVDIDERDSDYSTEPYFVLSIENQEDGVTYSWHAFHTVARKAVKRTNPQVGDVVGVKYVGPAEKKTAKPGQQPAIIWRFRVFERGTYGQAVEQATLARLAASNADSEDAKVREAVKESVSADPEPF
jgi:hypothetical protein